MLPQGHMATRPHSCPGIQLRLPTPRAHVPTSQTPHDHSALTVSPRQPLVRSCGLVLTLSSRCSPPSALTTTSAVEETGGPHPAQHQPSSVPLTQPLGHGPWSLGVSTHLCSLRP